MPVAMDTVQWMQVASPCGVSSSWMDCENTELQHNSSCFCRFCKYLPPQYLHVTQYADLCDRKNCSALQTKLQLHFIYVLLTFNVSAFKKNMCRSVTWHHSYLSSMMYWSCKHLDLDLFFQSTPCFLCGHSDDDITATFLARLLSLSQQRQRR